MKPIEFKEQNIVFAKDQPEYLPLPAHKVVNDPKGQVIFCQYLSFRERIKLLFTGKVWVCLLSFNAALTPSFLTVDKSDVFSQEKTIT